MSGYTKAEAKAADAILAELTGAYFDAMAVVERKRDRLHSAANDDRTRYGWKMTDAEALAAATTRAADERIVKWNRDGYAQAVADWQPAVDAMRAADEAIDAHEAANYKGWQRFFLVPDGHIHASRGCSSLRITTKIGWLPDLSGETEAEAVAAHGAMLCTKCFPSAPVEYTRGLDAPADQCAGSGKRYVDGTLNRRYRSAYGECGGCHTVQTVTQYGVMRKHKTPKGK
ncbi:hypothetical protein SEA_PHELPSODU_39 [Mycobacterium phage PhelpsODU]|uniref:Uncharacterized protein n=1 Tax=Mycobacterium phage Unicorn TaxID=2015825 RepID=A0A222ZLJ9_9CAUD|nr:hypothetical protein I5G78_gp066 [Mycobacterium phage Unicorn]ASR85051.1 hypothetical protein SEA_UNICORN_39 [Mycobacterium phage Unicorn]ASR85151.1 hypothetical protein SEA_PHELPSODU_39 [Mycobacterium phage PhelpsODU]